MQIFHYNPYQPFSPLGPFHVVAIEPKIEVREPEPLVLGCNSSARWFICTWKKEEGGEVCKFQYTHNKHREESPWKNEELLCDSHFKKPEFIGSDEHEHGKVNNLCQIKINDVESKHAGEYECKLERFCEKTDGKCHFTSKDQSSSAKISVLVLNWDTHV